jgi:hypothetical protein
MRAAVDAELDKGLEQAYPLGISYCDKVLYDGRAFTPKDYDTEDCGRHASLIIGRRPNPDPKFKDSCQYLIRNSWGKNCSSYHDDWTCEAEKGSVWVDADVLGRAIHDVQTLVPVSDR